MPSVLYRADVVCPMAGPPLPDGGVLVREGVVAAVADAASLAADADREIAVSGVLLPGFVNARTQLEHSDAAALARPGPHHMWLRALDGMTNAWPAARWGRSAQRGVVYALRAGSTAVFDVVTRGPAVPAACRAGLAGDSWVEVAMVDIEHQDAVLEQVEHALGLPAKGRRVGIAPHSPTALGSGVLQALAVLAKRRDVPLHVAAAHSDAEVAALRQANGPLADVARERGMAFEWLDAGTSMTPIRYLEALGVLTPATTVAHGVGVDAGEARLLARRGTSVACCPRSNELLQTGQPPLERYAEAGTPLALGTGSPAAVADLDVLAEAAAWTRVARARGVDVWPSRAGPIGLEEAAVRLATVDGARAMGWGERAGLLEPGRRADLVGVELATSPDTVYRDLVSRGPGRQVLTVLGGVRKARRASADEPWPAIDDESWRA